MGAPGTITITLEALTEQARAKLNSFFNELNGKVQVSNSRVEATGKDIGNTFTKGLEGAFLGAGMSYKFRAAIDGVKYAIQGDARSAFYFLDETIRGSQQTLLKYKDGLLNVATEIAEVAPIAAVAALGLMALHEIMSRPTPLVQYLAKQNDALKEQANWLQIVQKLHAAGAISEQTANHDSSFSIGSTEDLMGRSLVMGSKEGAKLTETGQAFVNLSDVLKQLRDDGLDPVGKKLEEVDAKFEDLKNSAIVAGKVLMASGKMSQAAYDALIKSIDAAHEAESNRAVDDANFKNREANQQKAQEAFAKGQEMFTAMVVKENADLDRELNLSAAQQGKTREEIYQQEYDARIKLLIGQYYAGEIGEKDYTNAVLDAQIKRMEGLKREQDELRRLQAVKDQMAQRDYDAQRRAIQNNPFLTGAQKNQQLQANLADNISDVGGQLDKNLATPLPAGAQQQIQLLEQRKQLQSELNGLIQEQGKLQQESGSSFVQSFGAMFANMKTEATINFNTLATTFADVFNSALNTVSGAITKLITGTMTWRQALMEVGQSILTTLVGAIVNLAVRWIATQIMMAVAGKAILAAATAATAPIAAAAAAIWATPATLATIASYGAAAAAAPGEIAIAQGLTLASALGSFLKGGYTGDGPSDQVAGLVHRGEVVIPAERVQQTGVGRLMQFIRSGRFSPSDVDINSGVSAGGGSAAGGSVIHHKTNLSLATFGGEADAERWAKSEKGDVWFFDQLKKHVWKFQR